VLCFSDGFVSICVDFKMQVFKVSTASSLPGFSTIALSDLPRRSPRCAERDSDWKVDVLLDLASDLNSNIALVTAGAKNAVQIASGETILCFSDKGRPICLDVRTGEYQDAMGVHKDAFGAGLVRAVGEDMERRGDALQEVLKMAWDRSRVLLV
jgi:hypothetical protein